MKTEIVDFKMHMHMSGSDEHSLIHCGKIKCENHILHGKEIYRYVITPVLADFGGPKKFGEAKVTWVCEVDTEKDFDTIQDLLKHYKLPELHEKHMKS